MTASATTNPRSGETSSAIAIFHNPAAWIAARPDPAPAAPTMPPTSACDELTGMPKYQVGEVPEARGEQRREHHRDADRPRLHDFRADGLGDGDAEQERSGEVRSAASVSAPRALIAREAIDRGDDVRAVVEAVEKVERQRHGDQHERAASRPTWSRLRGEGRVSRTVRRRASRRCG